MKNWIVIEQKSIIIYTNLQRNKLKAILFIWIMKVSIHTYS